MRQSSCGSCGVQQPCWTPPIKPCVPCLNLDLDPETGLPVNPDDAQLWDDAWETASAYVYDKTCQRWPGKCYSEIVRPCISRCGHPRDCRCGTWSALDLSSVFCMPFCDILGIYVDGKIWDQPWRIEKLHHSVPCMGGSSCGPFLVLEDCPSWPAQTLNEPLSEECTWAIVAQTGCEPPNHVLRQSVKLAEELVKATCDPESCQLPDGVESITRKGMTMSFNTETTGLPLLDAALDKWECKDVDFETWCDPTDTLRHHSQFVGPTTELEAALTSLGLDPALITIPEAD